MNPAETLEALRWREDDQVTNPFGERVFLREEFHEGKRVGITDCCPAADPCDWHKALKLYTLPKTQ